MNDADRGNGGGSSGGSGPGDTSGSGGGAGVTPGGAGGTPDGIGGWPGEDLSPEVIACRQYLMGDDEGAYFTEEQARTRCEVCAEAIAECAPRRQCVGGYCYPDDEGQWTCTCSEGARCLESFEEWQHCLPAD